MTPPGKRKAPKELWVNVYPGGFIHVGGTYRTEKQAKMMGAAGATSTRYILALSSPRKPRKR